MVMTSSFQALLAGVHDVWLLFEGGECVTSLLAVAWWQVGPPTEPERAPQHEHPGAAALQRRATALQKAAVPLTMVAAASGNPVGLVPRPAERAPGHGYVLAAPKGGPAASLVLRDNEDGTWGLQVRTGSSAVRGMYACATAPSRGGSGGGGGGGGGAGALLSVSATTSNAPCARFRVQVMAGGTYALRSAALGLWVRASAGTSAVLAATAQNPRGDPAAAFNFTTTLGLPPR